MRELSLNTILHGDALTVLRTLPDESFDCCVTDPPYELGFMGKAWDKSGISYNVDLWKEVLRVLKPGAFLLAFGGSRTYHRITCAIEDAGFEIRDMVEWLYGSGFPKSLDISKAIDKAAGAEREILSTGKPVKRIIPGADQNKSGSWIKDNGREYVPTTTEAATDEAKKWKGWGTALKPAHEPICVARKPFKGTVAENVLRYGTGGINVDGCRIGTEEREYQGSGTQGTKMNNHDKGDTGIGYMDGHGKELRFTATGRWPANVILDEEAGEMLDQQSGILTSGNNPSKRSADKHRKVYAGWKGEQCLVHRKTDSGGASRFFYCAKASPSERGEGNTHPTVKPIALIKYLIKLVCPPGGIVVDPFIGSGTTMRAAIELQRSCISVDLEYEDIQADRTKKVQVELFP